MNQKGFSTIIILLIAVGALIIGAGAYFYSHQNRAVSNPPVVPSPTSTAVIPPAKTPTAPTSSLTPSLSPPVSIFIISPKEGAVVSGMVQVHITVSSSEDMGTITLLRDGHLAGAASGTLYLYTWDTAKETKGPHTLTAVATTNKFSTANSKISVMVTGGIPVPSISFAAPQDSSTVAAGKVNVAIKASSSYGIARVTFFKDNIPFGSASSSPYLFTWDATKETSGIHSLGATAYDARGLSASTNVFINVIGGSPPLIGQCREQSLTADACHAHLNEEVDKANYCDTTSDCFQTEGAGCLYSCGAPLVNKNEADRIQQAFTDFQNLYSSSSRLYCIMDEIVDCIDIRNYHVACVNNRCQLSP